MGEMRPGVCRYVLHIRIDLQDFVKDSSVAGLQDFVKVSSVADLQDCGFTSKRPLLG
jgi:hypothetical protein